MSAVLWGQELPTEMLRPDLAPEQMVQLLSALQASCLILAVRRDPGDYARMAAVGTTARRTGFLVAALALTLAGAALAGLAMPSTVAAEYVRNVAAYAGVGLALGSVTVALGLAVPWLWFALSVTVGQRSDRGAAVADWWAYPLQDAGWHPWVSVVLLAVGFVAWLLRS